MGIDPAPFWTNLFLHTYENQSMTRLISNNKIKARHFHSTKRFTDDLCAISRDGKFGCTNSEIYSKELELKPENQGTNVSFLNLDINRVDGKFVYKLFDKRDSFPFFIVRRPYTDSNIPNNIIYSAFVAETLRIARSALHFSNFLPRFLELVSRILRQDNKVRKCYSSLKKLNKYEEGFSKFGDDTDIS